jgi:uncharacterized protein YdcH (DUF465 family)
MNDQEFKQLAERDPELRRLMEQHQALDRQVDALNKRRTLTPTEEQERKRLSKLKLASKDQIAERVARLKKDEIN